MKTELKINLSTEDCKKIYSDLKELINSRDGFNSETYLLYNKIKGFLCAYDDIEKE